MRKVGLWKVAGAKPEKLEDSEVHLEKHLEDWIAADPALLQSGLVIVGRQINLEGGGGSISWVSTLKVAGR